MLLISTFLNNYCQLLSSIIINVVHQIKNIKTIILKCKFFIIKITVHIFCEIYHNIKHWI